MTHSYACHDSFKCVPFLFHILAEAPKYSNIKILACFRVSRTRQHRDIRMFSSSRIPEDTTECNRVGPGMADFLWWVHSGFERIWKFWDNEQGFLMFLEGFLKILGGFLKRHRCILTYMFWRYIHIWFFKKITWDSSRVHRLMWGDTNRCQHQPATHCPQKGRKCNLVLGGSPSSDMGWPWTGWIGPAPVQMSGCCLGAALSWLCDGLLQGLVVFHWPFVSPWTVTSVILGLRFLRARLLRLCCTAAFPPIFLQLRKGPLWGCAELLQSYALCSSDQCRTVKLRSPAVRELFWGMGGGGW